MSGPYDDILHQHHHVSPTRPRMPSINRAAQFAPFDALTGYKAAVMETARTTDRRIELADDAVAILDMKLRLLADMCAHRPEVAVTYFQADERKEGGAYIRFVSAIKMIDEHQHAVALTNGNVIPVEDIVDIDCELLKELY